MDTPKYVDTNRKAKFTGFMEKFVINLESSRKDAFKALKLLNEAYKTKLEKIEQLEQLLAEKESELDALKKKMQLQHKQPPKPGAKGDSSG